MLNVFTRPLVYLNMLVVLLLFFVGQSAASPSNPLSGVPDYHQYTDDWTEPQAQAWIDAQKRLSENKEANISEEEKCQVSWSILWQLAKQGNLEARYEINFAWMRDWIYLEGWSQDYTTRMRTLTILDIHTYGAPSRNFDSPNLLPERQWSNLVTNWPFMKRSKVFKECMINGASQECTRIAVDEKFIPSFKDFAAEIDLQLANGAHVMCDGMSGRD